MQQEMVDIYDAEGKPAGSATRTEAHRSGLWHKTVHIWMVDAQGRLLLQKRSHTKESFPGLWDISAAGHITAGDTSLHAAVRELEEELGVIAREEELTFLFTIRGLYEEMTIPFLDHEISDVYLVKSTVGIDQMVLCCEEVDEVKFFSIEELKREQEKNPHLFVPHYEEWEKLFSYLAR